MDLLNVKNLFNEFNNLHQSFWKRRVQEDKNEFESFNNRFQPFDFRMQKLLREESPHYNIFDILNVRHRETKLHTPFLVNLLDPKASHEQGSLFLNAFFKNLLHLEYQFEQMEFYEIQEERANQKGQIDILILFRIHSQSKAIVIENKIYAGDQDDQLTRYHYYLTKILNLSEADIWLVYLTPTGKWPAHTSMEVSMQDELRKSQSLIELGYYKDIMPWLMSCNRKVESVLVQETITQYIKTIKSL